jgi:DNA-binding LacI/PurR family transcriptional regulator
MATVNDVARLAGVSVSTVSYALSGARPITAATRERIERAMDELGYIPNALAQGLASRRSHIIALMFPTLGRGINVSGLEYVMGAADRAQESGYHLLLWTSDDVRDLRKLVKQGLVDGVLVMEVRLHDERIKVLSEEGVPFALIGRTDDTVDVDFADSDFAQMTRLVVEHLAALGHRSLLFLNQAPAIVNLGYGPSARSSAGLAAAAEAIGAAVTSVSCESTPDAGRAAFAQLVVEHPDVTAVVSMNEEAVVGLMAAAAENGMSVPERLSVVAMASSPTLAMMAMPALTTCGPDARLLGRAGVDALLGRLASGASAPWSQVLFDSTLEVRGSSGPRWCPPLG